MMVRGARRSTIAVRPGGGFRRRPAPEAATRQGFGAPRRAWHIDC